MSVSIEWNAKEIQIIICKNIIKMLYERGLIDNYEETFDKIKDDIVDKIIIELLLNNNTKYNIYFYNVKITSINTGTPIDDYLSNNIDIHKIIIFKDFTKKVFKQIINEYKNSECFFEHELLEDITSKDIIPIHQLLNSEEKKELLTKFNESEFALIKKSDRMARHYNAQIGDIFRIIRCSITSGNSIFYRKVIHNSDLDLDYLFQ
jgi:DNA-directed RNA polymerase subunit H (RpoH/RPB5)